MDCSDQMMWIATLVTYCRLRFSQVVLQPPTPDSAFLNLMQVT